MNCGQLTCIEIRASDVLLDGAGHLVDGKGFEGSIGITVNAPDGARNVTVRNVRAREWDYGVYLRGVVNSSVDSSALQDNLFGAVLYRNATGNTVRGCNVTGNGYGLVLSDGAAGCVVSENRIVGNECGLYLDSSDGVTVSRNVIAASTDSGIQFQLSGSGTFYDNRFANALNVAVAGEPVEANAWSVTPRSGPNIVGGPSIGGNFWGRPDGAGFSEVTADRDGDGFSDAPLTVAPQNVDDHPLAPSVGLVPTPEATRPSSLRQSRQRRRRPSCRPPQRHPPRTSPKRRYPSSRGGPGIPAIPTATGGTRMSTATAGRISPTSCSSSSG